SSSFLVANDVGRSRRSDLQLVLRGFWMADKHRVPQMLTSETAKAHVLGIALLRERGVKLISASDGQNLTEGTDEMTEGMITIMAAFAQIEIKRDESRAGATRETLCARKSKAAAFASRYFRSTRPGTSMQYGRSGLFHPPPLSQARITKCEK